MTEGRHIEYLPLAELSPDEANPKDHATELLDASVGRFGFVEPIVRDERTGRVISGHGRMSALQAMEARGDTPPDGIHVDAQGVWTAPVVVGWASRSDSEAQAALVALNRAGESGGWIDDALTSILDNLADIDDGLAGVGFNLDDLDDLHVRLEADLEAVDAENDIPAGGTTVPGPDGTSESPSLAEYASRYEEQGRRMVVLDYDRDAYAVVVARLAELRHATHCDNNSDAVAAHLAEVFPNVLADEQVAS